MLKLHLVAVHWNSQYEPERDVSASERGQIKPSPTSKGHKDHRRSLGSG